MRSTPLEVLKGFSKEYQIKQTIVPPTNQYKHTGLLNANNNVLHNNLISVSCQNVDYRTYHRNKYFRSTTLKMKVLNPTMGLHIKKYRPSEIVFTIQYFILTEDKQPKYGGIQS